MRCALLLIAYFCSAARPMDVGEDWGFHAHRRINRMACFTLPPAMFGFYKRHIDHITDHAVDPDKRRYAVADEAPRHYIDLDHYVGPGQDFRTVMPRDRTKAVELYGEDTLQAYGIVPWHIPEVQARLVRAFQRGDVDGILRYSAELGHYIGDAHVPLHTTENYNGQLTGQHGIHAFWESRIPELSSSDYDHLTGRARYVASVSDLAWDAVLDSHAALDTVLRMEREVQASFPEDLKYVMEDRGRGVMRFPSREFTAAYERSMGGMVERRMNASIIALGSCWYTAWVDAGQPDLDRFEQRGFSDSMRAVLKAEEELVRMRNKALGRPEPNE